MVLIKIPTGWHLYVRTNGPDLDLNILQLILTNGPDLDTNSLTLIRTNGPD